MTTSPKAKNEDKEDLYKNAVLEFIDVEQYPPEFVSYWVGAAMLSFSNDPTFEKHPDKKEAMEMLKELYSKLLPFLNEIENIKKIGYSSNDI